MFDAQVDIMARALVTGMTRVATLQAGSADNNVIVPVGPGYPHHITSHGDQNIYNQLQQLVLQQAGPLRRRRSTCPTRSIPAARRSCRTPSSS